MDCAAVTSLRTGAAAAVSAQALAPRRRDQRVGTDRLRRQRGLGGSLPGRGRVRPGRLLRRRAPRPPRRSPPSSAGGPATARRPPPRTSSSRSRPADRPVIARADLRPGPAPRRARRRRPRQGRGRARGRSPRAASSATSGSRRPAAASSPGRSRAARSRREDVTQLGDVLSGAATGRARPARRSACSTRPAWRSRTWGSPRPYSKLGGRETSRPARQRSRPSARGPARSPGRLSRMNRRSRGRARRRTDSVDAAIDGLDPVPAGAGGDQVAALAAAQHVAPGGAAQLIVAAVAVDVVVAARPEQAVAGALTPDPVVAGAAADPVREARSLEAILARGALDLVGAVHRRRPRGSAISSSTLRSCAPSPSPLPVRRLAVSLADSVRPIEASCRLGRIAGRGGPGGGRRASAAWSRIVPKIDSVPSSLSKISSRRLCCGQSASAATRTLQKPPPWPLGWGSTAFTCEWPATQAITCGYCSSSVSMSAPRWIGRRAARVEVAAGLLSCPWGRRRCTAGRSRRGRPPSGSGSRGG